MISLKQLQIDCKNLLSFGESNPYGPIDPSRKHCSVDMTLFGVLSDTLHVTIPAP